MEKINELDVGYNQCISINERKTILVSGVKKIESFDNEEFFLETILGYLVVKGEELEIIKLDTYQGNISIKGKFNSLAYIDNNSKMTEKNSSFISKLFK